MSSNIEDDRAFPDLDAEEIETLASLGARRTYQPGEFILRSGDADIDLVVCESGSIAIHNPVNENKLIVSHGPGQFVGDIDMLTRRPIIIDAVAGAGEPTTVIRVSGAKLRQILNTIPRLGEKLMIAFQVRRQKLQRGGILGILVVGPGQCPDTNRVREFLYKNFVPFTWFDGTTDQGKRMLADEFPDGMLHGHMPIVKLSAGKIMRCPKLSELAKEAGIWRGCPNREVDLAIVGCGPAGIAAAVYAASEGLRTIVLDRLGPGGQAGGSSKIENFIGFPAGLTGTDLATRGVLQMLKFGAEMVAPVNVDRIEIAKDSKECHKLYLDCGNRITAHTILATTGVTWRRLSAEGAEKYERAGVYYACTQVEASLHQDVDVAVVGAGNSAGQAAMYLAERNRGRTVHMLIRRTLGPGMSGYLVDRIRSAANVKVHEGAEITRVHGGSRIECVDICRNNGEVYDLHLGGVFVFIGAEPQTGWLPDEVQRDKLGYVLTGVDAANSSHWPLTDRQPCPLETTVPRILAAGDIRAGSTKRVGFAVGDGSLAVTCAHRLRAEIK